jgi:hypothetical protein
MEFVGWVATMAAVIRQANAASIRTAAGPSISINSVADAVEETWFNVVIII